MRWHRILSSQKRFQVLFHWINLQTFGKCLFSVLKRKHNNTTTVQFRRPSRRSVFEISWMFSKLECSRCWMLFVSPQPSSSSPLRHCTFPSHRAERLMHWEAEPQRNLPTHRRPTAARVDFKWVHVTLWQLWKDGKLWNDPLKRNLARFFSNRISK